LGQPNYEQRQAIIFLTIVKRVINYQMVGDFNGMQFQKLKGDEWNMSIRILDSSRSYIPLTGATVKIDFATAGYIFNLSYVSDGIYSAVVAWNDVKAIFTRATYDGVLTIEKQYFASVTETVNLQIAPRTVDLSLQGDFSALGTMAKVKGSTFMFQIQLIDDATGLPITDASVKIVIASIGRNLTLEHTENGIYLVTDDFAAIQALMRDATLDGQLIIERENFRTETRTISINIKMEEFAPGVPKFYVYIGVALFTILFGTMGTYKAIQNARIPAFVKVIDKMNKMMASKKKLGDANWAPTKVGEIVERFDKDWKLLDLNLATILGGDAKPPEADQFATPSDTQGGN
jgi:hypothetical protein